MTSTSNAITGARTVMGGLTNAVQGFPSQSSFSGLGTALQGLNNISNAFGGAGSSTLGKLGSAFSKANTLVNAFTGIKNALTNGLFGPSTSALSSSIGPAPNPYTQTNFLEKLKECGDPLLSFEWVAVILDGTTEVIEPIYINSIQTPSFNIETHSVYRDGTMNNYAGAFSVGDLTIGLLTTNNSKAFNLASNWMNSICCFSMPDNGKRGFYLMPADYKKTIHLFFHDISRGVALEMRFIGCFPKSWESYSLSSSSSDALETTLTLSVDNVVLVSSTLLSQTDIASGSSGTAPSGPFSGFLSFVDSSLKKVGSFLPSTLSGVANSLSGAVSSLSEVSGTASNMLKQVSSFSQSAMATANSIKGSLSSIKGIF